MNISYPVLTATRHAVRTLPVIMILTILGTASALYGAAPRITTSLGKFDNPAVIKIKPIAKGGMQVEVIGGGDWFYP